MQYWQKKKKKTITGAQGLANKFSTITDFLKDIQNHLKDPVTNNSKESIHFIYAKSGSNRV